MDKRELTVRKAFAELAEASQKHLPPFNELDYTSTLDNFEPYIKAYPEEEQGKFINALISLQKFRLGGEIFRDQAAYELLDPIRNRISKDFFRNLESQRHRPFFSQKKYGSSPEEFKIKHAKLSLVKTVERDLPEYKKYKPPSDFADPSVIYFSKSTQDEITYLLAFDFGTLMPVKFEPIFIFPEFYYSITLSDLLSGGGDKGTWNYETQAECDIVAAEMISFLNKVIPIFEETVNTALAIGE